VCIGIIKSLDSYFQLGRISETHRMVSLAYSQINKKIAVELALNRKDRISPKDMLSIVKTDIKNLEDISPLLPEDVLEEYKKEFGELYQHVKKPNITNGLSPVEINKSIGNNYILTADLVHSRNVDQNDHVVNISSNDNNNAEAYKTNVSIKSNNSVLPASINSPDMGEPM